MSQSCCHVHLPYEHLAVVVGDDLVVRTLCGHSKPPKLGHLHSRPPPSPQLWVAGVLHLSMLHHPGGGAGLALSQLRPTVGFLHSPVSFRSDGLKRHRNFLQPSFGGLHSLLSLHLNSCSGFLSFLCSCLVLLCSCSCFSYSLRGSVCELLELVC